jgi:hypothetical protein
MHLFDAEVGAAPFRKKLEYIHGLIGNEIFMIYMFFHINT